MSTIREIYKKTGNNVEVNRNDILNKAIEMLMHYDSLSKNTKKRMRNPYDSTMYAQLENGKMIQIPEDIQNEAIIRWSDTKYNQEISKSDIPLSRHITNKIMNSRSHRGKRRTILPPQDDFILNEEVLNDASIDQYTDQNNEQYALIDENDDMIRERDNIMSVYDVLPIPKEEDTSCSSCVLKSRDESQYRYNISDDIEYPFERNDNDNYDNYHKVYENYDDISRENQYMLYDDTQNDDDKCSIWYKYLFIIAIVIIIGIAMNLIA